jgi:hypothetical protein
MFFKKKKIPNAQKYRPNGELSPNLVALFAGDDFAALQRRTLDAISALQILTAIFGKAAGTNLKEQRHFRGFP